MKLQTNSRLIIASLIGGLLALGSNAAKVTVTQTVDSVKWQLVLDTSKKTAQLGVGARIGTYEAANMAVLDGMPNRLVVPSSFTIEGDTYNVNAVANRAFPRNKGGYVYNAIFPLNIDIELGENLFNLSAVSNILFKGPSSVESGKIQSYSTMTLPEPKKLSNADYYNTSIVLECNNLKYVVVGPNVKVDDTNKLVGLFQLNITDAVLIVPRSAGNMSWDGSHTNELGGVGNSVVYYGPSEAFDIEMYDTYATFIPNTEEGLTTALELAQTFETVFNIDARLAVRKRINMTAEVAESALQSVTLTAAPPWYLTFAVQTQSQLDSVLAVVQKDIPIIIDIDGATEDICVPEGRQVAILAKGGWTFGKKHKGLIIQFK